MQAGPLTHAPLADNIPVELHRIPDNGRQLADHQMKVRHATRLCLARMPKGDVEEILCDRELMHCE